MISIMISPTFLSVSGHAGYNPGNDIVCAAVSALVQTFEASAREFTTDEISSSLKAFTRGGKWSLIKPKSRD